MENQTNQNKDRISLEALTENYFRQAQRRDLTIRQKVEAMAGNVLNIKKLSSAFMASEEGRKAIAVSLRSFNTNIDPAGSDKTFKPVRSALMIVSKTVAKAGREAGMSLDA